MVECVCELFVGIMLEIFWEDLFEEFCELWLCGMGEMYVIFMW